MPLLKFAVLKSAISTVFAAAFAAGYLGADMVLPDWTTMWRVVAQIAMASVCAGILSFGLTILSAAERQQPAELFKGHDEILVLVLLRALPFLTCFAASVLAVVLVLTIRPDIAVAGVVSICVVLWLFDYESATDRFLCTRLRL